MYTQFYGFKERPFNVTPDARFFYPSHTHKDALESLYYAVNEKRGFAVLSGSIGAGKTTVWRTLLKRLSPSTKVAVITNTHLTGRQLIEVLLEEFNIESKRLSKTQMLARLNKYLIEQFSQNNNVLLIIDEAQNLAPAVLEEIRMLSNLETEAEKLLQILLIGQNELKDKLVMKNLSQLRQRITVTVHINPLTREETENYMNFRISKVSDKTVKDVFTQDAIDKIHEYSNGVPRLINSICDGALLVGYATSTQLANSEMVSEAVNDFLACACLVNK